MKGVYRIYEVVVILVLLLVVGAFIHDCIYGFSRADLNDYVSGLGVVFALVALYLVSANNYHKNIYDLIDDLYWEAWDLMQTFLKDDARTSTDRLILLSVARCILRAQRYESKIWMSPYKTACLEIRNNCRIRLRTLFLPNGIKGWPREYYADSPEEFLLFSGEVIEPIAENSLAVIYRFLEWPAGLDNITKSYPGFSDEEIEKMSNEGPTELGDFMKGVREKEKELGSR